MQLRLQADGALLQPPPNLKESIHFPNAGPEKGQTQSWKYFLLNVYHSHH